MLDVFGMATAIALTTVLFIVILTSFCLYINRMMNDMLCTKRVNARYAIEKFFLRRSLAEAELYEWKNEEIEYSKLLNEPFQGDSVNKLREEARFYFSYGKWSTERQLIDIQYEITKQEREERCRLLFNK